MPANGRWDLIRSLKDIDMKKGFCKVNKKIKFPVTGPVVAKSVGRGIALLFHDHGTRRG